MGISALISRIIRADPERKSRFHTMRGELVLSPDIISALTTTVKRVALSQHANLPWLTYPAIRFIDRNIRGRRLFEFGSGTSTKWYAERCREVHSVENNAQWFVIVKERTRMHQTVSVKFAETDNDFFSYISDVGGLFDAIVIDSQPQPGGAYASSDDFRVACLLASLPYATPDCLFIVDNTDAMPLLNAQVDRQFSPHSVRRMSGWVPGIFHPNETTIVLKAPQ